MKTQFKKTALSLAIVSVLLSAANGNADETAIANGDSAWRHGHKAPKTQLVSVNSARTDSGNGFSYFPTLSANGRFVVFQSEASDLVNDIIGPENAFVRDLKTGKTILVGVNHEGTDSANGETWYSALSANGRFVAFYSAASDLVANDTNGANDVFVRDLKTGTTTLVSVDRTGKNSGNSGSGWFYGVRLSADGRFVAFYSAASDLVVNDTNGLVDAFVRDLKRGTTSLVVNQNYIVGYRDFNFTLAS